MWSWQTLTGWVGLLSRQDHVYEHVPATGLVAIAHALDWQELQVSVGLRCAAMLSAVEEGEKALLLAVGAFLPCL